MGKASDLLRKLREKVASKEYLNDGLDFVLDEVPLRIVRRTILGKDLTGNQLKPLSENYIRFRIKNKTILSNDTRPKKSNLTLTGEMLSSIQGKREGNKAVFSFSNDFSDKKALWAREKGRPFFGITELEKGALYRKIAQIIRENFRKAFK